MIASHSVLHPPLPGPQDSRLQWSGLSLTAAALALTRLAAQHQKPQLIITENIQQARELEQALAFFRPTTQQPLFCFPDWETLPYDHFSPHADLISQRLLILSQLGTMQDGYVIVAMPTLMHLLPPANFIRGQSLDLQVGNTIALEEFRRQLTECGYRHVEQVMQHGEVAMRGAILDLFPMGSEQPYRIELFDNEIESIRIFDPDTQRSTNKISAVQLLPAREFPLTEDSIRHFRNQWRARFAGNPMEAPIYVNISQGQAAAGIEYYLPLFHPHLQTLIDYLPPHCQVVTLEGEQQSLVQVAEHFWQEVQLRYEQLRHDQTRPLCAPAELFTPVPTLFAQLKQFPQLTITPHRNVDDNNRFATDSLPDLRMEHQSENPCQKLKDLIKSTERTLLLAESLGRREVLLDLCHEQQLMPSQIDHWSEFLTSDHSLSLCVSPIEQGFYSHQPNFAIVTEASLFGEQVRQNRLRQRASQDPAAMIRDLSELRLGAPVVHLTHGVGRYQGLKHITIDEVTNEYLVLEYANNDLIYVPVASLHLISRYTGGDPDQAPLHRLGSSQWQKARRQAAQRARDVAAELLSIYGKREASSGFAFNKPTKEFDAFCREFPFEETPDQQQAIQQVIQDMTQPRCMDRLVCGDVGFGKTEVAMRAAFIAVQSHQQVAVLVPTTLLANQHAKNFQDRFANWPVKIACLSRMRSQKEQQQALQGLADGQVDIVIGTHKLLQPSVKFKRLGLLVVDEEHRFGVRDKERIKALRAQVDILTLTATPIPRTLNLSLAGTRDLSIIATPPARRLAIKTFVHEYQKSLIREAVLRETMRGGQIYFMHNKVETIEAAAQRLRDIVPDARIAIAHGQMHERELERVMSDFYHQRCNILVCTTIIESGIDVPNANTIIIDRADHFGLAQLHQLRGRVGRSHHQAYAYLLIPSYKAITSDAKKRLDAISQLEDLGAGFNLATHDLEIRGAGELLGDNQSGHMQTVGFSLFMDMLEQAVQAFKRGEDIDLEKPPEQSLEIDLKTSALIPEDYVRDTYLRLTLYKRLSGCRHSEAIQQFKAELIDRFGPLPDATKNLLQLAELKLQAEPMGIQKIDAGRNTGTIVFKEQANINPAALVKLIQTEQQHYQLQGSNRLRFVLPPQASANERLQHLQSLLQRLQH